MSKFCPNCGKALSDTANFCGDCGQVIAPAPPVQPAVPAPGAPAYNPPEKPEYTGPTVPCAPDRDDFVPKGDYGVPLQGQPVTEKKNKYLGLGVGISVALIALILALIAAVTVIIIMLIPNGSDAKSAVEKYAQAYIDNDYRYYYSHDYYTVFNTENVDEKVDEASKDAEQTAKSGLEAKVLNVTNLSDDTVAKIKKSLENNGYKSVDKIEDIKAVTVQSSMSPDSAPEIGVIYTVKVDGEWYIASRGY